MEIKGNVFLVAGGASGLGAATVQMLVQHGAKVVIADLNRAAGEALARVLPGATRFVETNVADEASGQAAVALALSAFGRLNGLVNCAGIVHGERIVSKDGPHSMANFRRMVEVNLIGTFNMVRLAADAMSRGQPNADGERGVIVNTASVAAYDGKIGHAAYSASKGGVVSMTLPLARDLASFGIRVVTIAPGIFDTPLLLSTLEPFLGPARAATPARPEAEGPGAGSVPGAPALPGRPPTIKSLPKAVEQEIGKMVPFPPRLGRPSEFAGLVKHILENEMLNGEVIRIDGAIRFQPK